MAFRYVKLGHLVTSDPRLAHGALVELFLRHKGSARAVAKELGVYASTVTRWCEGLQRKGLGDPRLDKPPTPRASIPIPVPSAEELLST